MHDIARLAAAFVLAAMVPPLCPAEESGTQPVYHVAARYAIGGTDVSYDHLRIDGASRRLFVAHGSRIEVLDADTGTRLGQVSDIAGVHGIEIVEPCTPHLRPAAPIAR